VLLLSSILIAASLANADIRPLLREQGFNGPLNGSEKITYVGHVRQGRDDYQIYTFYGVFRAAAVYHGVNAVIVVLNGSTFVGDYKVDGPTVCQLRRQQVICAVPSPGRVIEFTKDGPPRKIWFDGQVVRLNLGSKFKN
jgi:hypothetical protein